MDISFSSFCMLTKNKEKSGSLQKSDSTSANYPILSAAVQRAADNGTALPPCVGSIAAACTIHCKTHIWHLHIHHLAKLHYF